ncbi:MAG: NTP transferase domain-containing protein [Pseudomonadota bacterium]
MTSVLILAGSRPEPCPVCVETGVETKAIVPIQGVRMIDHMLRALRDCPSLTGDIWISGHHPDKLSAGAPEDLRSFLPRVQATPDEIGPAHAALSALNAGASCPLLITTCDHPLLTPQMIDALLKGAEASGCDFAVGLAPKELVQSAYPETERTYLNLAGEGYSGCNLFLVRTPEGRRALEFWRDVAHDRKNPLKIARRFGFRSLVRMFTGQLNLAEAFAHGSKRIGAKLSPIVIPFAEAAIDVDKPADLALVRRIMKRAS